MVIMMAMGAVISSTPVVPGGVTVRIRLRIAVIRSHVIPVRVIIVGRGIGIIAARKSEADSPNTGKSRGDLSVGALSGNQSQSAYRQPNQEKFFHRIFPSYFVFCEGRTVVPGISSGAEAFPPITDRIRAVARFPRARNSRTVAVSAWSRLPAARMKQ
jgi:hypothetical protein